LLDAFANHTNLIKDFHQIYRQYQQLQAKLQELENLQQQTKRDQDYYQFQLNEIEEAQIQEAEEDQLERELDVLSNAEKIKGNLQEAITLLFNSEQDVQGQVAEIRYQIGEISNFNESLEKLYERLNSLEIEVKDIADEASDIEESVIVDNNRLEEVNNRLQLINQLLNKHGYQSTKDLLAYANELKANLQQTENRDQEIESLTSEVQQNYNHLLKLAQEISNNRYGQIEQVQQKLVELLKYVGIPEATLHIHLDDLPGNGLNDLGKDQITIYFSANKGVKPAPLNKVASGGELSRLMLGFKYTLADSIFLPTIVFDEIDIGISGEVAKKVGKLIKGLASQHQVISITHLPQVAALGDHHYKVEKSTDQEQTYTYINNLDEEASVYEVATMMAGSKPSETSLQNARELMDSQIEKSR
jgi:DNA repair protein RecN (Recombination protein N)